MTFKFVFELFFGIFNHFILQIVFQLLWNVWCFQYSEFPWEMVNFNPETLQFSDQNNPFIIQIFQINNLVSSFFLNPNYMWTMILLQYLLNVRKVFFGQIEELLFDGNIKFISQTILFNKLDFTLLIFSYFSMNFFMISIFY
jgi:hypothetical protein